MNWFVKPIDIKLIACTKLLLVVTIVSYPAHDNEHSRSWVFTWRTILSADVQTSVNNRQGKSAKHSIKQILNYNQTPHSPLLAWCVRAPRFSDTSVKCSAQLYCSQTSKCSTHWGCGSLGWVVRVTPTNPVHRERIRGCIKTTAPTGMCHIQMGALLSPDKALVLCHIPEIHDGEGGLGKEWYFSHWGTKPLSVGLRDSHMGRKTGWVITIITTIILPSRQLLLTGTSSSPNQIDHSSRWDNIAV